MSTVTQSKLKAKTPKGEGTQPRKVGLFDKQVRISMETYVEMTEERARIMKIERVYLSFAAIMERSWASYRREQAREAKKAKASS